MAEREWGDTDHAATRSRRCRRQSVRGVGRGRGGGEAAGMGIVRAEGVAGASVGPEPRRSTWNALACGGGVGSRMPGRVSAFHVERGSWRSRPPRRTGVDLPLQPRSVRRPPPVAASRYAFATARDGAVVFHVERNCATPASAFQGSPTTPPGDGANMFHVERVCAGTRNPTPTPRRRPPPSPAIARQAALVRPPQCKRHANPPGHPRSNPWRCQPQADHASPASMPLIIRANVFHVERVCLPRSCD